MNISEFKNHLELIEYFKSDKNKAIEYLEHLRWGDNPTCPHCGNGNFYKFKDSHTYKCSNNKCYKKFTVTVNSIFENTKVPLYKWFATIYVFTSHKRGISSHQLAKDLSLTQKTTWLLIHKVREMLKDNAPHLMTGVIECDETFVGGKVSLMNKKRKAKTNSYDNKTAVFSALERETGRVVSQVLSSGVKKEDVLPVIYSNIRVGSTIHTDEHPMYRTLDKHFIHESVKHYKGEYSTGNVTTNTVEGFFSVAKRTINGTYFHIAPKHLQSYFNEIGFRYYTRNMGEVSRYELAISQSYSKQLTWNTLTNKSLSLNNEAQGSEQKD